MTEDRKIMVVDRVLLFADEYFQGFSPADVIDYEKTILDNYHYEKRKVAENNPDLKQPIAYCLIVNPKIKKVFAYQRSQDQKEYTERRLQGKWSWGIGGHIDKIDLEDDNPIHASLKREIAEEIIIERDFNPKIIGYINDDETPVGQVHFGILYLIEIESEKIEPNDSEIARGAFMTIEELEELSFSPEITVEEWSLIALSPLRGILEPQDSPENKI